MRGCVHGEVGEEGEDGKEGRGGDCRGGMQGEAGVLFL